MALNIWKKTVIRARKKQRNVSDHMNYMQFAFKDPKYAKNIVFFVAIMTEFLKYYKNWVVAFITWNIFRKLRISVISSGQ